MNRAPAFQFYAADYLADESVQLMTLEEEGSYIRLLAYCWREGSIPADLEKLSRLCKGASTMVLRVVAACFEPSADDASRLIHRRLEAERKKQAAWREKSAEGGRQSAKTRAEKFAGRRVEEPPLEGWGNTSSSSSSSSTSFKRQKDSCAEADSARSTPEKPVGSLPCLRGEWSYTDADVAGWEQAYPATDVRQQLAAAREWLLANPKNRKTVTGCRRFVTGWLAREQNRAPRAHGGNDFEQLSHNERVIRRAFNELGNEEAIAAR